MLYDNGILLEEYRFFSAVSLFIFEAFSRKFLLRIHFIMPCKPCKFGFNLSVIKMEMEVPTH